MTKIASGGGGGPALTPILINFLFFLLGWLMCNEFERNNPFPIMSHCERASSGTGINPLWGHCQEYKIEKNAILQERLLLEKRSTFVYYNLTLSESICFADHEKQIQKFVAHQNVCQKSSQREVIGKNAYKAPKPQGVYLPAFHLKFSRSLTNFQASPARQSSLRLKIDFQTTLSSRSQLEASAGKPFASSSTIQTPRQEMRTTSPQGTGMKGSSTSEGQKDNFFCGTKVFSKRQYDRLSLSSIHAKNGDAAVTITTKNKVGVHLSHYRSKSIDGLTKG